MISTVLFDLDGLLSDTETLHCRAYQAVLRRHGQELSDEHYAEAWIRLGLGIADFLRTRGLDLDPAGLRKAKAAEYTHLVETCCVAMPGAMALLDRLKGRRGLGLASSAWSDAVYAVLKKLAIAERFSCIVTGAEVERLKPHPDIFLEAARRLGVPPSECVVIEDAEKGIRAGKAAGMKCIAVPNRFTAGNDFSAADLVLGSLDDVTLEMVT
jgi:beta-phosphoglucomutase